jgi:class 3 adenylate cyclase
MRSVWNILKSLFNLGITSQLDQETAKHIRFINIWVVCIFGFGSLFSFVFLFAGQWQVCLFGVAMLAFLPVILQLNRRHHFQSARVSTVIYGCIWCLAIAVYFAAVGVVDYNFPYATIVMGLGCFVIYPAEEQKAVHFSIFGFFLTYNAVLFLCNPFFLKKNLGQHQMDVVMLYMLFMLFVAFGYLFRYIWLSTERKLKIEREKSERLLLNILPAPIADRLRESWQPIADHHADVTVLFADIVDFTGLAEKLPPGELVTLLNRVFQEFDRLAAAHGLEKIKTIGDAYMAVCGLPEARSDHAEAVASMALEMVVVADELSRSGPHLIQLRIGIHTGPVVAGVIGLHKFSYDLWGDTVNIASRMESQGEPGIIRITDAVKRLLPAHFMVEEKGVSEVKGRGPILVYHLIGKRDS